MHEGLNLSSSFVYLLYNMIVWIGQPVRYVCRAGCILSRQGTYCYYFTSNRPKTDIRDMFFTDRLSPHGAYPHVSVFQLQR